MVYRLTSTWFDFVCFKFLFNNMSILSETTILLNEKLSINKIICSMKKVDNDYFYLYSLIPEKSMTPKDIKSILNLLDLNIFQLKE